MRFGQFEILLVGTDGTPLDEHILPDGQSVVSAEPGQSYHVSINVYRDDYGVFPLKFVRFGLYVDGVDVQYWKRVDLSNEKLLPSDKSQPVTTRFWGFKKNHSELQAFTFAAPSSSNGSSTRTPASVRESLGTVKVVIFEAQVSTGVYQNDNVFAATGPTGPQEIGEATKFWKQASVTTAAGTSVKLASESFNPLQRWSNVSKVPLATLVLRYHTPDMIQFLSEFQDKLMEGGSPHGATGARGGSSAGGNGAGAAVQVIDLTTIDEETAHDATMQGAQSSTTVPNCASGPRLSSTVATASSSGSSCSNSLSISNSSSGSSGSSGGSGSSGDSGDCNPHRTGCVGEKRMVSELEPTEGSSPKTARSAVETVAPPLVGEVEESGQEQELEGDKEVPIDEEISLVVRKKVISVVDFTDDGIS